MKRYDGDLRMLVGIVDQIENISCVVCLVVKSRQSSDFLPLSLYILFWKMVTLKKETFILRTSMLMMDFLIFTFLPWTEWKSDKKRGIFSLVKNPPDSIR